MKNFLCALAGALAVATVALPARAASLGANQPALPLASAVFHPGETQANVQTVQYDRVYRPRRVYRRPHRHYRRAFRHDRPVYHRGPPAPFRRY